MLNLSRNALFLIASWSALALPAGELGDKDHQKLGESLAAYLEARQSGKGVSGAMDDLDKELAKIEKRLKGRSPLSLTEDLGRAFWYARDYEARQKELKKGKVESFEATTPWKLSYAMHVPAKYSPKQAYPVILIIPDQGQKVTDHLIEKWIQPELREGAILIAVPMPEDPALWAERGTPEAPGGGGNVRIVYGRVTDVCATDFDRVYLAGWGAGVAAAVKIAAESPDLFAGVIGRSGDVAKDQPCTNFKNLPTWFAGAGAGATEFAARIEEAKYGNCTLQPEGQDQDVWAWIQAHPRISNPSEVVLATAKRSANKAYWIEIPPSDAEAKVEASVDRAANAITLKAQGVESVTLLFNDLLVDLSKPVKVVCNGTEHLDEVPRNITTTLELLWRVRSDPGKLYTASKMYDVPPQTN